MQVYLVYNPRAGQGSHEQEQIRSCIESADHRVTMLDPEDGLSLDPGAMIAIAGGDGTVGGVARRYCGAGLPMTIFPLGTANNIAASLGIRDAPAIFGKGRKRKEGALSLARVSGAGHERLFVEAVGCGLLRPLLTAGKPARPLQAAWQDLGDDLRGRVKALIARLEKCEAREYELRIDGRDHSGSYLMVEIMNIARVGPALELAPGKDPGSGVFEVVLVGDEGREKLAAYLQAVYEGREARFDFPAIGGRLVELRCGASKLHVDDRACAGEALFRVEADVCRVKILK